jgi:hypothetical protein
MVGATDRDQVPLIRKIVAGGLGRPTRLHTERGDLIPVSELRHLPRAVFDWASRKVTGRRPGTPWWPMPVIPIIETYLRSKECDVIEFGSGGSTRWLSERARSVIAIEDNSEWFEKVKRDLDLKNRRNAAVKFCPNDSYFDLSWIDDGRKFDLAIVDGSWRWRCVENVFSYMKPSGIIYLDNSDADKDASAYFMRGMKREAQRLLEVYAAGNPPATLTRHAGLINGEVHAGEGMILRLP